MPSKFEAYNEAYVWIWLPNDVVPVVAGKLTKVGASYVFNYGQSYLARKNRISIFENELPLKAGEIPLLGNLTMPSCLRDGAPDAWGRRVLINKKYGAVGNKIDQYPIDELTFLLESGSDRIGALDFQLSPTDYQPRLAQNASLDELMDSADRVEKGIPLTSALDQALFHGSPIGGARPKALIDDTLNKKKYIAKFSSGTDIYSVIKAEYIAMTMAKHVGIDVANVLLKKSSKKDVLLVERFDREASAKGWQRKNMVSALTLFGLDEMEARYASYQTLAEIVRHKFSEPSKTLKELFKRLVFNVLSGNTDDHARNHAAFYDGNTLSLTPAYDICPQARSGGEATQAMLIYDNNRYSQLKECLLASSQFLLSKAEAIEIIEQMANTVCNKWVDVCAEAELSEIDKNLFKTNQFFNPYAFQNLDSESVHLEKYLHKFKKLK